MNQIKLKTQEIGLSQREISVRLGKNPSYLAGVFRSGLSTAKQAELLELLDIVGDGGTVQSDDQIIDELSQRLADCQDGNNQLRDRLNESQSYLREANFKIEVLSKYNKHLKEGSAQLRDESGNYLMELEQIESKYRSVLIFNYLLSLVILGIAISWVLK